MTGEGAGGREGMQPGVQSPTCPCLLPVPKPNDSQIPDANSMMNSCSQCPSWTAVACAAAGLLTTISASVAAAHTLARGHTALRLTVRKSMHSVPELRARRSQVPPGAAADRTAHAVTSGCMLLHLFCILFSIAHHYVCVRPPQRIRWPRSMTHGCRPRSSTHVHHN